MTPGQLKFASQAHVEALARKAQEEPYVDEMTIGEVEGERRAINPFWYH